MPTGPSIGALPDPAGYPARVHRARVGRIDHNRSRTSADVSGANCAPANDTARQHASTTLACQGAFSPLQLREFGAQVVDRQLCLPALAPLPHEELLRLLRLVEALGALA